MSTNGYLFWSECQRCGKRIKHSLLVEDGHYDGLLVCADCYDVRNQQEDPAPDWVMRDVVKVPETSIPTDEGTAAPPITSWLT
jgi:hypothetical protein